MSSGVSSRHPMALARHRPLSGLAVARGSQPVFGCANLIDVGSAGRVRSAGTPSGGETVALGFCELVDLVFYLLNLRLSGKGGNLGRGEEVGILVSEDDFDSVAIRVVIGC